MANTPHSKVTNSRETLYAIIAAGVISLVLATLLTGNPFSATAAAYGDYSHEDVAGLTPASTTRAPAGDAQH